MLKLTRIAGGLLTLVIAIVLGIASNAANVSGDHSAAWAFASGCMVLLLVSGALFTSGRSTTVAS